MLNNPHFDLEVESLDGDDHVWNKILIDGVYYYFDNTWNITRCDTPSEDGLITLEFSKKYLLFGENTAQRIGTHHRTSQLIYNHGVISDEDYAGDISYVSQFSYQKKLKYYSYLKK